MATNAKGIISKPGRYGGTYAHKDIVFKFAAWISIEFELYFIKEFQRLKEEEQKQQGWSAKRELTKVNYFQEQRARSKEQRRSTKLSNKIICIISEI